MSEQPSVSEIRFIPCTIKITVGFPDPLAMEMYVWKGDQRIQHYTLTLPYLRPESRAREEAWLGELVLRSIKEACQPEEPAP